MKWTKEDVALLKQLYEEGKLSYSEIGLIFGRKKQSIIEKARKLQIRYNRGSMSTIGFEPFDQWNISRLIVQQMQKQKNG